MIEPESVLDSLSESETEILRRLADGETVTEISIARHTELNTVRSQVKAVLRKLGVNKQLKAVSIWNKEKYRLMDDKEIEAIDWAMNEHMYHHSICNNVNGMSCNTGCRTQALKRNINAILANR